MEDVEDEVVVEEDVPAVTAGGAGEVARRDGSDGLARVELRIAGDGAGGHRGGGADVGDAAGRGGFGAAPTGAVVGAEFDVPALGCLGRPGRVLHARVEGRAELAGAGAGGQQTADTDADRRAVVDDGVVADGDATHGHRHLGARFTGGGPHGRYRQGDDGQRSQRRRHQRRDHAAETGTEHVWVLPQQEQTRIHRSQFGENCPRAVRGRPSLSGTWPEMDQILILVSPVQGVWPIWVVRLTSARAGHGQVGSA